MKVGMMWFDGDLKLNLSVRIERAAMYYRNKYGQSANLCVIHPNTVGENPVESMNGMDVMTSASVLPNHFWLGIEDQGQALSRSVGIAA